MSLLTKHERYEILRLAKRTRGLYTAEKQALVFIADAQTMQDGVCRKALDKGKDFGYCGRQMQRGLHGNRRRGKLEFPGLIARGIVSASGYVQGGRAPGGEGLTPTYTINRDMLLKFIPETDDDLMGDTLGDTKGDTSPKKGDTWGDLIPTSSCSSSLSSSLQQPPESRSPQGVDKSEGHVVVDSGLPQNQQRGQENLSLSPEDRADRIIAASRTRQLERGMTDDEIFRDYKSVFDRLEREYKARMKFEPIHIRVNGVISINPEYDAMPRGAYFSNSLKSTAKHRHEAAALYRTLGRPAALAKWEDFLINEDHDTTTGVEVLDEHHEPTGRFASEDVERTWLLYDFVLHCAV